MSASGERTRSGPLCWNRRTLVVNLGPQVFPQPRLVLGEVVFQQVEEALVGVLRHGRVTQDEGAVLDERFGGLQGARGSANKLTRGAKACALRRPAWVETRFRAVHRAQSLSPCLSA